MSALLTAGAQTRALADEAEARLKRSETDASDCRRGWATASGAAFGVFVDKMTTDRERLRSSLDRLDQTLCASAQGYQQAEVETSSNIASHVGNLYCVCRSVRRTLDRLGHSDLSLTGACRDRLIGERESVGRRRLVCRCARSAGHRYNRAHRSAHRSRRGPRHKYWRYRMGRRRRGSGPATPTGLLSPRSIAKPSVSVR